MIGTTASILDVWKRLWRNNSRKRSRLYKAAAVLSVLLIPIVASASDQPHPLIEQLSREAYNVLAEFNSALDGKAYREACQILCESADPKTMGLLPDAGDRRLLVSLPVAIDLAMHDVPELRKAMKEHFEPLGQLRLNRAVAAGDAPGVGAVAVQFSGTAAAAEAHRWLGDRQLSSGRFARAIGHYNRALSDTSAARRKDLQARLRLAAALMGEDIDAPIPEKVEIGKSEFSAERFEELLDEIRESRRRTGSGREPGDDGQTRGSRRCPPPGDYRLRSWARVPGIGVDGPRDMPEHELDWAARQIAVAVDDRQMIVNNQIELVAFDLRDCKPRWLQRQPASKKGPRWPLVPMRPLLVSDRIFVRRLGDEGPELACLDADDGRVWWSTKPAAYVASDPLLVEQDLFALIVDSDAAEKLSLLLAVFDPEAGRVRSQVTLAEFHDFFSGRLPVQATAVDDKIVSTTGGCVLCCDLSGRVQWLRRQSWRRPPGKSYHESRAWLEQVHRPPLVRDGRVYATQPGVWDVECLSLSTGRLVWRTTLPKLLGPAGFVQDRFIVETADGLSALEPHSGKVLWRHKTVDRLQGRLYGSPGGIMYVRVVRSKSADVTPQFVLVWVDPQSGSLRASSRLNTPRDAHPLLGPLVTLGDRQWALYGSGDEPQNRYVLSLIPVEELDTSGTLEHN